MPSNRTVWSALPSFLGGLALGLGLWRWLRRGPVAEIDRQRLEGEAESERLRLRLTKVQEGEPPAGNEPVNGQLTIDLRAGGAEPAAAPLAPGLTAPGTAAATRQDDLQRIKGIGPVMERSLNGLGIHSYEQIAALTRADIDRLTAAMGAFPGRIERDDWVGSARRLVERGETASPS